ncbi:unnamed protein product, partial [Musa hybrid cultivar]
VCSYHVICDNLRSPFISPCDRCEKSSHSISRLGGDFCPRRGREGGITAEIRLEQVGLLRNDIGKVGELIAIVVAGDLE